MGSSRWWCVTVLVLGAVPWAWAGQYVLLAGQTQTVPVSARVLNGEQVCNLEITVPGQAPVERVVRAPFFDARVAINPGEAEWVTVYWRGQFRRVDDQLINACPVQGQARFKVVRDNGTTQAIWAAMLAQMPPAKSECVSVALAHDLVRPQWFDFTDPQPSAEDARIQRAFTRCDAFVAQPKAWGAQNPAGHACTVAGGIRSRCEGYFTASLQGQSRVISREEAIRRQLENLPWSTGVREMAGVRSSRIKAEQDRVAQAAAQEAARKAAQEAARIQAIEEARALAERQVAEVKSAKERALQDKIVALRAQVAQENALQEKQRQENRNWLLKQVDKITGSPQPATPATPAAAPGNPAVAAPVAK
jgi:hypothetical protein